MQTLLLLGALAGPQTAPPVARPAPAAAALCVFDGRTGAPASLEDLLARARAADVVHAGESHADARHHRAQAELIRSLGAAAGFEMITRPNQAGLDAYLAGGSEADFLADVWRKDWGYPFELYRPVFDAVRAGARSGAALNVPREIVRKVDRQGLAALTPDERRHVPAGFQAVTDRAYVAMLLDWYAAHGRDPADAAAAARFVDAMSLWNEGMAANLAEFLASARARPVVVLEGAFHAHDAGVPASLARRVPGVRQLSIQLRTVDACPASAAAEPLGADYVLALPR